MVVHGARNPQVFAHTYMNNPIGQGNAVCFDLCGVLSVNVPRMMALSPPSARRARRKEHPLSGRRRADLPSIPGNINNRGHQENAVAGDGFHHRLTSLGKSDY
jgi:hypothetical protein